MSRLPREIAPQAFFAPAGGAKKGGRRLRCHIWPCIFQNPGSEAVCPLCPREAQDEAKDLGSSRSAKKSRKFRTARATPSMPEWVVQEVGGGVRGGALTLLPAAKSSATSRHRLHGADVPCSSSHEEGVLAHCPWSFGPSRARARARSCNDPGRCLKLNLWNLLNYLRVWLTDALAAPADAATAGQAWAASVMSTWRGLSLSAMRDGLHVNFLEAGARPSSRPCSPDGQCHARRNCGHDSQVPASVLVVRVGLLPVDASLGGVGLNFACGELDVLPVPPMLPRARSGQVSEDPDDVPIPSLCETRRLVRAELNVEAEDEAQALCHAKLTQTLVCLVYAALVCAVLDPCGRRCTLAWSIMCSWDGIKARRA